MNPHLKTILTLILIVLCVWGEILYPKVADNVFLCGLAVFMFIMVYVFFFTIYSDREDRHEG